MKNRKNTLLALAFLGLGIGWYTTSENKTKIIDTKKTKIDSLILQTKKDSVQFSELKKNKEKTLDDTVNFYSDTLETASNLYHKASSEKKELKNKYYGLLGKTKKLKKEVKKYKTLDNIQKGNLIAEVDSLDNVISKNMAEINNLKENQNNEALVQKNKNLQEAYSQIKKKYNSLKNKKNSSSVSEKTENPAYDVREHKNIFEKIFEAKRPKLVKVGKKNIVYKDDEPRGMEAFVVNDEGKQLPLRKVDDRGIFSYSHLNLPNGTYAFFAVDVENNSSKKYIRYINNKIISEKPFD